MNFALPCFHISTPHPSVGSISTSCLVWHPPSPFVSLPVHSFCDIWICILFIVPFASSPENTPVYILDDSRIYRAGILVTPSRPYFQPPATHATWTYFVYRPAVKVWHTAISWVTNTRKGSQFWPQLTRLQFPRRDTYRTTDGLWASYFLSTSILYQFIKTSVYDLDSMTVHTACS
jgi:hypothetical protein